MRRIITVVLALVAVAIGCTATATTSYAVGCQPPDGLWKNYNITSATVSKLQTNLVSDYIVGPATISYAKTVGAQTSASTSATVSAEAGVIFAKASTTLGVTVQQTWTRGQTWTYSKSVPAGRKARLVMYHQSRHFYVSKDQWYQTTCSYHPVYRNLPANAPVRADINIWDLQYG
jgi:hypothetical protein